MNWRRLYLVNLSCVLLLLSLLLTGCSDTDGESAIGPGEGGEDDSTRPSEEHRFFMFPAEGFTVEGEVTGDARLKVFLYERSSGEPADNVEVSFSLRPSGDEEHDANAPTLGVANAFTDANGAASADVFLGTQEGVWTFRADHPRSNAVDLELVVGPAESGGIKVTPINASPTLMGLSDVDLRLYRHSHFDCQYFSPLGMQDDSFLADEFVPFTEQSVNFDNLGTSNRYVVTAVARGEHGQIAAGGCVGSIVVQDGESTDVEVMLQLVPLNPTGLYDVLSHWDFTDALADSGPAGSVIVRVLDIFENPGLSIYNEIISLIGNLVGGIISATFDTFLSLTGLDTTFQNFINDFIEGNEGLSQVWSAGRDLRDVVANLEVHSQLSIGKLAHDFEFRGQDNWLGITLYWTWGCEEEDGPDCGAVELAADDDGEFATLGVLSSDWNGRVAAYDQLHIDQHTVSLRYGRLIIYMLNDVLLPAVTDGNANSMSEAFGYWFGCDSIAESIIPDGEICAANYCLEATTVANFCETAVSTVFGFADILIENLEFDMGLRLGGEGRLVEETSDGMVDRIVDGYYLGYIEDSADGTPTSSSFTATFDAVRYSPLAEE